MGMGVMGLLVLLLLLSLRGEGQPEDQPRVGSMSYQATNQLHELGHEVASADAARAAAGSAGLRCLRSGQSMPSWP